jgi:hypothetical protein
MHQYKAVVEVVVSFKIAVEGAFNSNYKSGRDVAEQNAVEIVFDQLPNSFFKLGEPMIDAFCKEYELTGDEAEEVEDER